MFNYIPSHVFETDMVCFLNCRDSISLSIVSKTCANITKKYRERYKASSYCS